jgi:hypothetical protein
MNNGRISQLCHTAALQVDYFGQEDAFELIKIMMKPAALFLFLSKDIHRKQKREFHNLSNRLTVG